VSGGARHHWNGKNHGIANVISHYLAQGKRVLVTAKGVSGLVVLQEKLFERIRPLSVALLSDERDGMKQFKHSIQTMHRALLPFICFVPRVPSRGEA
jgi:hypothetical protein